VPTCVGCVKLARQARSGKDLPSAKIRMMLELLKLIDRESKGEEKTIIFSQFTKMLDVIEPFLKQKRIDYVRYDGSMSDRARDLGLYAVAVSTA